MVVDVVVCVDVVPAVVLRVSAAGGLVSVEVGRVLVVPVLPTGSGDLVVVCWRLVTVTIVFSVASTRNSFNFSLILKMLECKTEIVFSSDLDLDD